MKKRITIGWNENNRNKQRKKKRCCQAFAFNKRCIDCPDLKRLHADSAPQPQ